MASLRRNNVSQPISFISEETNIFVSTMLIIDAIFQTKNILNAVNSGEVRVKFGQVETPYRKQGKSTSSSRKVHGHISHTRPLSQPVSLLYFIFLFASKHTQPINKSNQRRISSFEPRSQGSFLCNGKRVRNEVKQIFWEKK